MVPEVKCEFRSLIEKVATESNRSRFLVLDKIIFP